MNYKVFHDQMVFLIYNKVIISQKIPFSFNNIINDE